MTQFSYPNKPIVETNGQLDPVSLAAIRGAFPARKKIGAFGSSSTWLNTLDGAGTASSGYMTWFHAMSRNCFDIHSISGVSGEWGVDQIERLKAWLTSLSAAKNLPDALVLQLFQNDPANAATISDIMQRWDVAIAECAKYGVLPIIYIPTPVVAISGTPSVLAVHVGVIKRLYDLCLKYKYMFSDNARYVADIAGATSYAARLGAQAADGVHLAKLGAYYAGRSLLNACGRYIGYNGSFGVTSFSGDDYHVTNNPTGNLLPQQSFVGALVSGVPTGWGVAAQLGIDTANSILTKLPTNDSRFPVDDVGNWYRLRINLVSNSTGYLIQDTQPTVPGSVFSGFMEMIVDTRNVSGFMGNVSLRVRDVATNTFVRWGLYDAVAGTNSIGFPVGEVVPVVATTGDVSITSAGQALRFGVMVEHGTATGILDIYLRSAAIFPVA